jgi:hypothetical protein
MRYHKKPVEIEAIQVTGDNLDDLEAFFGYGGKAWTANQDGTVLIHTLEGTMLANVGDWIIKGVAGEFYPCKPDIFAATYEPS